MKLIPSLASFATSIILVVIAVTLAFRHVYTKAKNQDACDKAPQKSDQCSIWKDGSCFKGKKKDGGCVLAKDFVPLILFIIAFALFVTGIVFIFLK